MDVSRTVDNSRLIYNRGQEERKDKRIISLRIKINENRIVPHSWYNSGTSKLKTLWYQTEHNNKQEKRLKEDPKLKTHKKYSLTQ